MQTVALAAQPGGSTVLCQIGGPQLWSDPNTPWGSNLLTTETGSAHASSALLLSETAGLKARTEGTLTSQAPAAYFAESLQSTNWLEGCNVHADRLPCTTPVGDSPASATFSSGSVTSGFLPCPSSVSSQSPQAQPSLAAGPTLSAASGPPMTSPAMGGAVVPEAGYWPPTHTSPPLQVVPVSVGGPAPCVGTSSGHPALAALAAHACSPMAAAMPAGMMLSTPPQGHSALVQATLQHHQPPQQQQQQQQQQGVWCVQVGDQLFPVGSQSMQHVGAAPMPAASAVGLMHNGGTGGMMWGLPTPMALPQQQQQQVWGNPPTPSVMVISSHASTGTAAMQLQASPGHPSHASAAGPGAGMHVVQGLMQPVTGGLQLQPVGHGPSPMSHYLAHNAGPPGTSFGSRAQPPDTAPHAMHGAAMHQGTSHPAATAPPGLPRHGRACDNAPPLAAGAANAWGASLTAAVHGSASGLMEPPGLGAAAGAWPQPQQVQPRATVQRISQGRRPKPPLAAVVYDAGGVPMAFAPRWAKGRAWDPQVGIQGSGAPTKGTGVFIPGVKPEAKAANGSG